MAPQICKCAERGSQGDDQRRSNSGEICSGVRLTATKKKCRDGRCGENLPANGSGFLYADAEADSLLQFSALALLGRPAKRS